MESYSDELYICLKRSYCYIQGLQGEEESIQPGLGMTLAHRQL